MRCLSSGVQCCAVLCRTDLVHVIASHRIASAEIEGSEQLIEADTVILAMGFLGPDPNLTKDFGTAVTPQTNIKALHGSNGEGFVTSEPGFKICGRIWGGGG